MSRRVALKHGMNERVRAWYLADEYADGSALAIFEWGCQQDVRLSWPSRYDKRNVRCWIRKLLQDLFVSWKHGLKRIDIRRFAPHHLAFAVEKINAISKYV